MKKITYIIVVALAPILFIGCGSKDKPKPGKSVIHIECIAISAKFQARDVVSGNPGNIVFAEGNCFLLTVVNLHVPVPPNAFWVVRPHNVGDTEQVDRIKLVHFNGPGEEVTTGVQFIPLPTSTVQIP